MRIKKKDETDIMGKKKVKERVQKNILTILLRNTDDGEREREREREREMWLEAPGKCEGVVTLPRRDLSERLVEINHFLKERKKEREREREREREAVSTKDFEVITGIFHYPGTLFEKHQIK